MITGTSSAGWILAESSTGCTSSGKETANESDAGAQEPALNQTRRPRVETCGPCVSSS
jgi:hypothetical protein